MDDFIVKTNCVHYVLVAELTLQATSRVLVTESEEFSAFKCLHIDLLYAAFARVVARNDFEVIVAEYIINIV